MGSFDVCIIPKCNKNFFASLHEHKLCTVHFYEHIKEGTTASDLSILRLKENPQHETVIIGVDPAAAFADAVTKNDRGIPSNDIYDTVKYTDWQPFPSSSNRHIKFEDNPKFFHDRMKKRFGSPQS